MSKFIIEVRTKGFGRAEQELKKASGQTRKFARSANDASTAGAVFRKEVSQLRNNMLLYTFAIGGAIAGMGRFVMAASDAREQASKFRVVFGEFAPEADAFAQSITESFGIAKSEMVGLLASLQDTFVPLGFSRQQATELSKSIAQLAMDVGSFNNLATGDVAKRFTSAIIGNHEAVRELGISLTEVSIKQEAQRLGLIDANEEMTQTAKILGRMSLIYNNTTDAQGDLIRTQDEFANRLRAVSGRFQTLKESIGEALMPTAEFGLKLANLFTDSDRVKIAFIGLTAALVNYNRAALFAFASTMKLNQAMSMNAIIGTATAFIVIVDALMDKIEEFGRGTVEAQYDVENLDDLVNDLSNSNLDLSGSVDEVAKAEEAAAKARKFSITTLEEMHDILLKVRVGINKSIQKDIEALKLEKAELEGLDPLLLEIQKRTKDGLVTPGQKEELERLIALRKEVKALRDAQIQKNESDKLSIDVQQEYANIVSKINIANQSSVSALKSNVEAEEFRLDVVDQVAKALTLESTAHSILKNDLDLNTVALEKNGKQVRINATTVMDFGEGQNDLAFAIFNTAQKTLEYNDILQENADKLEKLKESQEAVKEMQSIFNGIINQTNAGQIASIEATIAMIENNASLLGSTEQVAAALRLLNDELDALKNPEMAAAIQTFKTTFDGLESTQRANIQATIDLITANREAFEVFGDVDLVLQKLQEKYEAVGESTKKTTKDMEDGFRSAAATINTMTSAIRVLKNESEDPEQKMKGLIQLVGSLLAQFGGPQGAAAGAVLNLGAELAIGHTGGLIHNNGIQRFATGGMVQGQDNVPIMAQAGEFIMQRSAVQNIGVQNLAEMNRGGSAGGVTVNIQGNMIGNDEFVRDNLIPQLQKASKQELA